MTPQEGTTLRRSLVLFCLSLLPALPSSAATASLVRDIGVLEPSFPSSSGGVQGILPLPGKALLTAIDSSGLELWASDGTPAGTALLRDLCPGECSSSPRLLGAAGKVGFFTPDNDFGRLPTELWASDGTPAGTFLLTSSASGGPGTCTGGATGSGTLGSSLFFPGETSGAGCELWKSDGTVAGTRRVADLAPGSASESPYGFTAAGGKLYFVGASGLWQTDGTAAGTVLLHGFSYDVGLSGLRAAGARVFFHAFQGFDNQTRELWTSDGTVAGTRLLLRSDDGFFDGRDFLQVVDGVAYFLARDAAGVRDLWRSDGTATGTRRLTDVRRVDVIPPAPGLVKVGGRLLFGVADGVTVRLWASGGTPQTTGPLTGCVGGLCPALDYRPVFVQVGSRAVFAATDAAHGTELWVSDGTGAGTRLLRDLCAGPCSPGVSGLTALLGKAAFLAAGSVESGGGYSLWRTDGTPAGTVPLASLGRQPYPSGFGGFGPASIGKAFLFTASDGRRPPQLWASDGTAQGTGPLTVIGSGPGSFPDNLLRLGDSLLFRACDGFDRSVWKSGGTFATTVPLAPASASCSDNAPAGPPVVIGGLAYFTREAGFSTRQVWRTDGTDAGTFAVTHLTDLVAERPLALNGKAVFPTYSQDGGKALWESDGTVAGTRKLFDLPQDLFKLDYLASAGSLLWFVGNDGNDTGDDEIWVTDGTPAGTRALTAFDSVTILDPPGFTRAGGWVYFVGESGLMKSDGTPAGTHTVPLPAGEAWGQANLTEFKGALYFTAGTSQGKVGRGVWKTDGTAEGTVLLAPAAPPVDYRPAPAWLTAVGDRLFFVADDGDHGLELWQTDGTPAGTSQVRDIAPGKTSASPSDLAGGGGLLYFAAADPAHGVELWQSDGTAAGTHMVQDIAPGAASASPARLTATADRLFFTADDGLTGEELWALPLAAAGCQPSDEALCLNGGRFRVEATWRDPQGRTGKGHGVALTGDTGYFWFFSAANVEVILKVLDGTGTNGHRWVFYGALSNVEYTLTVTDTVTGAARRYVNPPGRLGSVADTLAFGPLGATGAGTVSFGPAAAPASLPLTARSQVRAAACTPSATRLCLSGGRFAVEARWRDFQGNMGVGTTRELSGDTGAFWFFGAANLELVVKVLDGRPVNGKIWVFYGALSNVEYTLTVTDTETGAVKTYTNPSGRLASVADTAAF
jgi:ELWxxDGT repeat protein